MIVAMEGLIPDRRTGSSETKTTPPSIQPDSYPAVGLHRQQGETIDSQPGSPLVEEEDEAAVPEPEPSQPPFANGFSPSGASQPSVPLQAAVPDTRVPFFIQKKRFGPHR